MSNLNQTITVGLGDRSYPIRVGESILVGLGDDLRQLSFPRRVLVVTNPTVAEYYGEVVKISLSSSGFEADFFEIPDGEQYKSLETLESIFDCLIRNNYDRASGVIALGGGVVGDIVGFAAACYLRGIPFVQVPTTLLSQVDSSVGGKTAVNHPLGKNLIGAFYQPRYVCIDVATLATLSGREYAAGLAEVIKYGVIQDRAFFAWLEQNADALVSRDRKALIHAVTRSCQIKANIVELDERESSLRAILNYGHTIGHAIEKLVGYGDVKHGEAVAMGMLAAARLSRELGLCDGRDVDALRDLLCAVGLPVELPRFLLQDYLEIMYRDKKVQSGMLRFVLNQGIGSCEIREVDDPDALLRKVFSQFSSEGEVNSP